MRRNIGIEEEEIDFLEETPKGKFLPFKNFPRSYSPKTILLRYDCQIIGRITNIPLFLQKREKQEISYALTGRRGVFFQYKRLFAVGVILEELNQSDNFFDEEITIEKKGEKIGIIDKFSLQFAFARKWKEQKIT